MKPLRSQGYTLLMVGLLYFTQGLPLGLAMEALPALLRSQGATLDALAFVPLVGLPWVLKCLWATRVDNHAGSRLGRRRGWIVPMQATVAVCLGLAALIGIDAGGAPWIVALAALASLASATQDIATDALTAEQFDGAALARANALQVGGTMVGFFFGGAGTLMIAGHCNDQVAMAVVCGAVLLGLAAVLGWREPPQVPAAARSARPRARLRAVLQRPGAWRLLALSLLSAMTAVAGYGLAKLFLVDAGWSLEAIGRLGMAGGVVTVVLGCGGGAWLIARWGAPRVFGLGIAACGVAAALWWLGAAPAAALPPAVAWVATLAGSFGAGSASVAIMTLGMRFAARGGQAGTDMTAVQSMRDLGEIATSSSLVLLAAILGYGGAFVAGIGVALLTLALALRRPAVQGDEGGEGRPRQSALARGGR